MVVFEILKVAIRGILVNKLRSLLTMIGIIVGVGSVILLIAFSEGARKDLLQRFEAMGSNRMGVYLNRWHNPTRVPDNVYLTLDDVAAIREQCSTIRRATGTADWRTAVRYGTTTLDDHTVLAAEPEYFTIANRQLETGRYFTDEENMMRERVCVLGSNTKYNMFYEADALGRFVIIDGKRFLVVGTMTEQGGSRWQRNDDQVIIPFYTAQDRMGNITRGMDIQMEVADPKYTELAEIQVREVLHMQHPSVPTPADPEEDPFDIWNIAEWQQQREQVASSLGKFLIIMGALALFIGGVGVMNIMLVTVQERTREIGLRKALGATRSVILAQFMTEAVMICTLGGLIGTCGAIVAARYMSRLPEEMEVTDPIITPVAIAVAVVVTVAIGVFFGVYPAMRAANLDPIKALHYE